MFVIKNVYFIVSIICFIFVLWSLMDSLLRKTKLANAVAGMILGGLSCILPFVCAIFSQTEKLAAFFYGLYFGGLDFSNYMFLLLVVALESGDRFLKDQGEKTAIRTVELICSLDFVFLTFNFIHHYYFTLEPVYIEGQLFCWNAIFSPIFYFHYFLCIAVAGYNASRLIIDAKKVTNFYKNKFYVVLTSYLLVFMFNGLFILFQEKIKLDFSLIVYEIFTVITYDFALYVIPNGIRKSMLSVASKNISDAVICFDYLNNCIYKNELAETICEADDQGYIWMDQYLLQNKDVVQTTQTIELDGELHIYNVEFRRLYDEKGVYSGSYLKLNDKTEDIKNLEFQQFRSTHDELTGLYNRNSFFSEMERIIKNHVNTPFYLITTNILKFKLINDLFGTQLGDNILIKQAEMLSFAKYDNCVVGRISGDKFAMLIPKENFKMEMAIKNTKNIVDTLKDINYPIIMKLGLYEISDPFENVHVMWDKANMAIKNNDDDSQVLCIYSSSLMEKLVHEKNVISEFKYALQSDQFKMYLQPQIDSNTGKCIGSEALVRWYDLDNNFRHPGEFIPILEKAGLIFQLDRYIWEAAAKQLGEWKKRGIEDNYISVNISVKDFYYGDLYKIFTELVKKYDISPRNLNLEITESVIIGDKNFHRRILTQLRDFGFRIEMDDFGSGYSSLNALKDMRMDVLKIDMEFLSETNNELRGKTIISSIVKMAKALGMSVISEGVETESQTTFLRHAGVDIFQGYLYSKPIPVKQFEKEFLEVQ